MYILDVTNRKMQVVLAGAKTSADCPWSSSWVETKDSTFPTPGSSNGTTNGTTAVDIVPVPNSSAYRQMKGFSLNNADTGSVTVTIRYLDNATPRDVYKAILPVGYSLDYDDGIGWMVHDTTGALVTSAAAFATNTIALGTAAAAGSSGSTIRADATILAFDGTTPATLVADGAGAVGAATVAARRDHNHPLTTYSSAVANSTPGAAGAAGTSGTNPARGDHTHRTPGGVFSITAQLDIVNAETAGASFQFPAAFLATGSVIRLVMSGVHTTSTTPGSVTLAVKVNTTSKGATSVASIACPSNASIATQPWSCEAIVTVRSATTAVGVITVWSGNAATGAFTALDLLNSSTASVTISNVSNALFFEITVTTGASTSHLLVQQATVEVVKM